jgi:hypothetical protein
MRPLCYLFPAFLLGVASGAPAQTQPAQAPAGAPIQTVEVTPPAGTFRLRNEQAERIGGVYDMANGWSVLVRADARYVDVAIDGKRPMRLRAVSSRKFVSGDGGVTMEFSDGHADNDMVMRYRPAPGLAEIVVSGASMARR